jgi:hypothetical protein
MAIVPLGRRGIIAREAWNRLRSIGHLWEDYSMTGIKKNAAAVALGRLGGLKGGKARARKLTPEQRTRSARKAALVRWAMKKAQK